MEKQTDRSTGLQAQLPAIPLPCEVQRWQRINDHLIPGTYKEVHSAAFSSKVAGEQPLQRIKNKQYLGGDGTSRVSNDRYVSLNGMRNVKQSFGLCRQTLNWDIALFPPRLAIAAIDSNGPIFGKSFNLKATKRRKRTRGGKSLWQSRSFSSPQELTLISSMCSDFPFLWSKLCKV